MDLAQYPGLQKEEDNDIYFKKLAVHEKLILKLVQDDTYVIREASPSDDSEMDIDDSDSSAND